MLIDRIAHTNRWRHRPLSEKALLALGLLLLALVRPPWPTAPAVIAVASAAALFGARVPPAAWGLCLGGPAGFVLAGTLPLAVQFGPDGLALAPAGITTAADAAARALAGVACLGLLALTTPAMDLIAGLRRLGLPAEVAEIALLTYRLVFLLAETAQTMHRAQAARLGDVGVQRRLRSLGRLAANLLPRALERAHQWEIGLAARGLDGGLPVLTPLRPAAPLRLLAVAALLAAVAALGVDPTAPGISGLAAGGTPR